MADLRDIPTGRNNYINFLARIMHEHGIRKDDILKECFIYQEKGFDENEITKTVTSALKNTLFQKFSDEQLKAWRDKHKAQPTKDSQNTQSNPSGKKNKFNQIKGLLNKKYDFRFNIISNEIEYKQKHQKQYDLLNENDLIVELMEANFTGVEAPLIALLKPSFVLKYDPFEQYFKSLSFWDENKPDYITKLAGYVKAKDQEWFNLQFKKMLVRSIACALNTIPFNKQCLTLVGK